MDKSPHTHKAMKDEQVYKHPHPGERVQTRLVPEMEQRIRTPPPMMTLKPPPPPLQISDIGRDNDRNGVARHPGDPAWRR